MRIADWPMALVWRDLEQRAALRALDRCQFGGCVFDGAGGLRADQAQQPAMRRVPRVPGAWRARTRRGTRGPRWRQAEAVDFADDGVPGHADLGGDLTAGQAGADTVPELLDALRCPGFDAHKKAPRLRRPVLGRRQGESCAQPAPRDGKVPQSANSVCGGQVSPKTSPQG